MSRHLFSRHSKHLNTSQTDLEHMSVIYFTHTHNIRDAKDIFSINEILPAEENDLWSRSFGIRSYDSTWQYDLESTNYG